MKTGSLSDYAKYKNVNRSTVTRWKQSDRLVFDDNGLVDFKASDKRIKATEDPNRDDVRHRHAINRGDMPAADIDIQIGEAELSDNASYQESRAKKERYLALMAKIDYEKSIGELIEREQVKKDWINVATIMRSQLERIPDLISAELAQETDYNRVHAVLAENIENVLKEAAQKIESDFGV